MDNVKGNLTTIIKFLVMMIAPYFGMVEATQNQLIAVIVAVIGLILAYFDAKYDNTLINQPNIAPVETEEDSINPEYTVGEDDGA